MDDSRESLMDATDFTSCTKLHENATASSADTSFADLSRLLMVVSMDRCFLHLSRKLLLL